LNDLEKIRRQLVWDRLLAIVEDQAQTLMRTAFSTVVREAGDLSAGVFDERGRMLAQAVTGTPGHVNAMARSVNNFLEVYPLEILRPGDVLVTNDPWLGTGHLNDFTVLTPVFLHNNPVALFASTSHIADVGGRGFGPDANSVFEEGINIPISYLMNAGEPNETLRRIIRANVRDPVVAEGDLHSLTACNRLGGERLCAAMVEFDLRDLKEISDYICDASELAMEEEIGRLKNGIYTYSMTVDGYDEPVDIACALTIKDKTIDINFSGSSVVSKYGINVPLNYTEAYACFGVRCLVGNNIPNNFGSLRTIRVDAPEGTILNARSPNAVSARHALGQMLPDVVFGCLSQIIPEWVPAEGASCIWNPVLMNAGSVNSNNNNDTFVINPIFNGGTGARPTKDGLSTTAFPSGVRTTSTEINEVTSPLIIWRRQYLPNSAGDGQYRGGFGQVVEIGHLEDLPFMVSKMFDRIEHAPRGRSGGGPGRAGRVYLRGGVSLRGKGKETIPAGKTLVMETPGGGGMGDSRNRPVELRDVDDKNGLSTFRVGGSD